MLFQHKNNTVAQILPSFAEKDAIGKQVMAMDRMIRNMGFDSKIYATHCPEKYRDRVFKFEAINQKELKFVIYHHSIGDPIAEDVKELEVPIILYYHNITPAQYYKNYSQRLYHLLLDGREQLDSLAKRADLGLGVSRYNEKELKDFGCTNTDIFPIVFDTTELENMGEDRKLAEFLNKGKITEILFVGRYSPNKCHADVIRAFYLYNKYYNPVSRLNMIGNMVEMEAYVAELSHLIAKYNLEDTVLLNDLQDDTKWKTYYKNSDIFLCASEHEGFFVPALEANFFELPIVAYDAGAVADTVGDGGIVVQDKSPEVLAELIHKITTNQKLRQNMIENGRVNYQKYTFEKLEVQFQKVIGDFINKI